MNCCTGYGSREDGLNKSLSYVPNYKVDSRMLISSDSLLVDVQATLPYCPQAYENVFTLVLTPVQYTHVGMLLTKHTKHATAIYVSSYNDWHQRGKVVPGCT